MASPNNNDNEEQLSDIMIIFNGDEGSDNTDYEDPLSANVMVFVKDDEDDDVYHLVPPGSPRPPPPIEHHPSQLTYNRLRRELNKLMENPPEGCQVFGSEDTFEWLALINGPEDSLYEGGLFKVLFQFPANYPFSPPFVRFETKILHCNVSSLGWICPLDNIWMPVQTVDSILKSLQLLLMDPIPEEPMNDAAASLYIHHRETYEYNVRIWTELFAKPEDVMRSLEFID